MSVYLGGLVVDTTPSGRREPQTVLCDRCGQPADADRLDVTGFGDAKRRYIWGRIECTTPNCVDEEGSTAVLPPDEPGQLTREDRKWIAKQNRLAEEFGRAERALKEAT